MLALVCNGASAFSLSMHAPLQPATHRRPAVAMAWGEDMGESDFNRGPDGRSSQLTRDHGKLVITLATTGNINTKERNPTLPCSPQEMADQMHECIKLGVSVLHIHARDENNKPTMRLDKFRETVRLVKERDPDVVIQISTGGRAPLAGVSPYTWRMDPLNLLPEMASYTPGSVNLGPIVYQNDAKLTLEMAERFRDFDIKPQVEVFDTNMMSNADILVRQGVLKRPLDFGFVMGAPGAQECSLRQLGHLISMMQPGDTWTSIGIGKFEMPLAYMAIAMGGHVRVGLEDNNKTPDGKLATNADLVRHVVEMAKAMGREIASPAEAREILSMPVENIDRILPQLDPSLPLETLVTDFTPYENLVPYGPEHPLELKPYEEPYAEGAGMYDSYVAGRQG